MNFQRYGLNELPRRKRTGVTRLLETNISNSLRD